MEIPIWAWRCCTSPTRPPSSGWHPVTIQTDLERRSEAWICLHIDDEALHCSYCKHKPTGSQTLPNIKNSEKQGCKQSGARWDEALQCSYCKHKPTGSQILPNIKNSEKQGCKGALFQEYNGRIMKNLLLMHYNPAPLHPPVSVFGNVKRKQALRLYTPPSVVPAI